MAVDLYVLMAAYGGEDYIADQIDSVLSQTLAATGILIHDRSSDSHGCSSFGNRVQFDRGDSMQEEFSLCV